MLATGWLGKYTKKEIIIVGFLLISINNVIYYYVSETINTNKLITGVVCDVL